MSDIKFEVLPFSSAHVVVHRCVCRICKAKGPEAERTHHLDGSSDRKARAEAEALALKADWKQTAEGFECPKHETERALHRLLPAEQYGLSWRGLETEDEDGSRGYAFDAEVGGAYIRIGGSVLVRLLGAYENDDRGPEAILSHLLSWMAERVGADTARLHAEAAEDRKKAAKLLRAALDAQSDVQ